jgi:hypothetical protein
LGIAPSWSFFYLTKIYCYFKAGVHPDLAIPYLHAFVLSVVSFSLESIKDIVVEACEDAV